MVEPEVTSSQDDVIHIYGDRTGTGTKMAAGTSMADRKPRWRRPYLWGAKMATSDPIATTVDDEMTGSVARG